MDFQPFIQQAAKLVLLAGAVLLTTLATYLLFGYLQDRWLRLYDVAEEVFSRIRRNRRQQRHFRTFKRYTESRKREVRNWLDAKIQGSEASSAVNPDIVAAQRDGPKIKRLIDEEVPNIIRGCVQTHRLHAEASGAVFIREIAWEEDCLEFRQRVVDVVEVTIEMLHAYPLRLDDHRIQHDAIVLRKRILPICSRCPFLDYRLVGDPKVCPSAEIAGVTLTQPNHHDCKR